MKRVRYNLRLSAVALWLTLLVGTAISVQAQVNHMLGLTTVSSLQRMEPVDDIHRNTIHVGMYMGREEFGWLFPDNVQSISPQIEYSRQWTSRFRTDVRLNAFAHSGYRDQTVRGMGDLIMIGNYRLTSRLGLLFGVKAPLANGNHKTERDAPFPLAFQPSTGTFDLIAGASIQVWRLQVFAAWQQPVTRSDFNYPAYYYSRPIYCATGIDFNNWPPPTPDHPNRFQLAPRLLLSVKSPIALGSGWVLIPGLTIQGQVGEFHDKYWDGNDSYTGVNLGWSALSTDLDIPISQRGAIRCMIAAPLFSLTDGNPLKFLFGGMEYRHRF